MTNALSPAWVPSATGSLDQFIRAANQAPYLTPEQEYRLAVRLQDEGDVDAARQLVVAHLRHVVHVARHYAGYGLPLGDLIQEGCVGLMKAVRRYDPRRGTRLVSFAVHWIRAEIHDYVLRNWHILKIATTKAQRKLFFNLRRHKPRLAWLTATEAEQIAKKLGVAPSEVLEMDARLTERPVSFDPLDDADEHAPSAPADVLSDDSMRPDTAAEDSEWNARQSERLHGGLESLDPRSRDIVEARWLREDKQGLKELGDKYGISAERVRQLEQQALKRLRHELTPA